MSNPRWIPQCLDCGMYTQDCSSQFTPCWYYDDADTPEQREWDMLERLDRSKLSPECKK
jgi:hypothetical protein